MQDYGWQNITKMPKEELVSKINIFVTDSIMDIIMNKSYPAEIAMKNKSEEIEIIRNHELVKLLNGQDKEAANEKLNKALQIIEAYGKMGIS